MDPFSLRINCLPSVSGHFQRRSCEDRITFPKDAQWNSFEKKIFVTACETVIVKGHRKREVLHETRLGNTKSMFNSNSCHNWNKQQLKNRWDALRLKQKRLEELLHRNGIEYNPTKGRVAASKEWCSGKIKENKSYKEFKDKDCKEVYSYKALFKDAFDSEKYAITPTKLYRTGFVMFENSRYEDYCDEVLLDDESSGSNDEAYTTGMASASMDLSNP